MEINMNRKWLKVGIVGLLVVVLAIFTAVASAQRGMGDTGAAGTDSDMLTIVADQLGIERTELVTELQSGKTIAELAQEKNVNTDAIVDAVVTTHQDWFTSAVESGTLTQEQADAHLALMKANLSAMLDQAWNTQGFGMHGGMGMGGFGMHDGGMGMGGFGMHGGMGMDGRGSGMPGSGFHHGWDDNTAPGTEATPEATQSNT
jgi:hypothetical protein